MFEKYTSVRIRKRKKKKRGGYETGGSGRLTESSEYRPQLASVEEITPGYIYTGGGKKIRKSSRDKKRSIITKRGKLYSITGRNVAG